MNDLLMYYAVAYIIHLFIMWAMIEAATKSKNNNKQLIAQTKLLAKIAKAQGVSDDELKSILDDINKK